MIYGSGKYSYKLVEDWVQLPKGETFKDVCGIGIDGQDQVYVLNRSVHPVMIFSKGGDFLSTWGEGHFTRAHNCCMGPNDTIYCTDDKNHTVTKFDLQGNVLMVLGTKDQPSDTGYRATSDLFESLASITHRGPPFNRPTGVALSSNNDIFISDGYGNAGVHKFTQNGTLLFSWGGPGGEHSQFRLPHSIWVDRQDRVWVTDRENSRIQIFTTSGDFVSEWTNVFRPTDLCIDENDIVYVSELCRRVSIFTIDGELITRWGNEAHEITDPLFLAPHGIAVDSRGDIYVGEVSLTSAKVDRGPRTIQKFSLA
jgi:DNA-binding beta-propeller fold protein YncE